METNLSKPFACNFVFARYSTRRQLTTEEKTMSFGEIPTPAKKRPVPEKCDCDECNEPANEAICVVLNAMEYYFFDLTHQARWMNAERLRSAARKKAEQAALYPLNFNGA
jgi:hypothetical protein